MKLRRGLTILLGLLLVSSAIYADDPDQVNFLNWADYINPRVIPTFEKHTGITVNQSFFDGADMQKAKLLAGGNGYDLTVPDLFDLTQEIPAGVFQPLDKSALPNLKYIDPAIYKFVDQVDVGARYSVVYQYGTTGIAYNPALIAKILGPNAPVDDWKILMDPYYLKKLQNCGVSFLDEPIQVFGITMHYLGLNPKSTNPADYYKAAKYLMSIRQYLLYFDNNRYITDLSAGNLCLAMGYSGDTLRARVNALRMRADVDVEYSLPKGGAPIWFDMLAIPKNAPHLQATLEFLNYLLDPKVAAENSNYLYQPSANLGATQYYNAELRAPNIIPNQQTLQDLFTLPVPPPKINALETRLWMQVKYGVY